MSATSQETDCKPRIGDFNAHYDPSNIIESSVFGNLLYRWTECNNLFQVINEPTRVIQNGATILDLIITNCPGYFVQSGTLSPSTNCDHSLIFAKMNLSFSEQKCYKRLIWNFNNVNESELHNSLLAMDLESQIDCEDINIQGVPKKTESNFKVRLFKDDLMV